MEERRIMEASNDVQIFNNAAFDSGGGLELERSVDMKASWMDLGQKCLSTSIESDSSKENHNPLTPDSPSPFKTPVSNTLLQSIDAVVETTACSGNIGSRKGMTKDKTLRDEAIIDAEIEQAEMEMSRLSLKLESLKQEKAEMKKPLIRERRCSTVPAKYMGPISKQSINSKTGSQRRGVSLCPAEIYSASKSRQAMTKPDVISSNAKQGRRQSCFWKVGEINELKVTKARGGFGKSASVSPKPPRNPVPKADASKKAGTTVGSKKANPQNDAVQPKKLFQESERSVSASVKKPFKSGRVIPSRYNQNPTQAPESVTATKVQSLIKTDERTRAKKRWEIPAKGNVVVYMSNDGEECRSTVGVDEMGDVLLRKIRTTRCVNESPRDSGAVKRVADLVGKKSFFADGGQGLSFVDEEEEADYENDAPN